MKEVTYPGEVAIATHHRMVCEYSQNILYCYLMILLWYLFVAGIMTSCAGFFYHIKCINNQFTAFKNEFFYLDCNNKYDHFTFVECDYLQIIKKKNVEKARKIAEAVYKRRIESQASKKRDSALLMEETQH